MSVYCTLKAMLKRCVFSSFRNTRMSGSARMCFGNGTDRDERVKVRRAFAASESLEQWPCRGFPPAWSRCASSADTGKQHKCKTCPNKETLCTGLHVQVFDFHSINLKTDKDFFSYRVTVKNVGKNFRYAPRTRSQKQFRKTNDWIFKDQQFCTITFHIQKLTLSTCTIE